VVNILRTSIIIEDIKGIADNILPYNVLVFLKKQSGKTIKAWSRISLKVLDDFGDL